MMETKWYKNIQLNAPLQRKRMSVTNQKLSQVIDIL